MLTTLLDEAEKQMQMPAYPYVAIGEVIVTEQEAAN